MINRGSWVIGAVVAAAVASAGSAFGEDNVAAEIAALKARIAELERKENENWLSEERASQIKQLVHEVIQDSRQRGQFLDGDLQAGYKDGFFLQTADKNYKLVVGGFVQVRYTYAQHNATNGRRLPGRTVGTGSGAGTVTPDDPANANGFDIRRARVNFSGNVWNPDLTYKLEGDFYGSSGGGFTVTDAFFAYRFNDLVRVKAGSFKVPFAKAELTSDTNLGMMERPEVLAPFDPIRGTGVSVYGEVVKETLGYEVNVNNGAQSNTIRRVDTVGGSPNLDNRMAYYGRVAWAGAGKLSDFNDEPDLRKDNSNFVWLVGAAGGYESQNATNNAFPSPQTSTGAGGLSSADSPGFINPATLNGDLFRGTVDWSAKYRGLSLIAAGYFQQFNYNPGNTSSSSPTSISTGPYGAVDSSFFQYGGYGQVGYMVTKQLELVSRAGMLATEGYPNYGEFYTVGANYYFYGHGAKLMTDITYTPEAAYTDAATSLVKDTHQVTFRVQLQLKF